MNNNYLIHHGILGMKWGVRRTPAQLGQKKTSGNKKTNSVVKKERKKISATRRHLSEGDLKKAIDRLQTEKKLKNLTDEDVAPGRTAVQRVLVQIGKTALTTAGTAVVTYGIKAAMEGKFDIKEAAKFIRPRK